MSRAQVDAARSTSFIGLQATGLWWWQLELDGAPVAVAGRSYRRQRECRYNLDQFLLTWSSAVVPAPSDRVVEDRLSAGSVFPLRGTRSLPGPGGIDFKGQNRLRVAR